MIFGQWKPTRIALAALLFGFFRALGNVYTGFDFLKALNLPSSVYNMLPYIISLVVLAFTSKKSRAMPRICTISSSPVCGTGHSARAC